MTAACAAPIWSPERTDCESSAAGLSGGSILRIGGRPSARWISAAAQSGDAGSRHLHRAHRRRRRQGRCGRGRGRLLGCIDIARRPQPVAGRSGLRFQGPGSAAQLQGAQKSLSAAGQGPKQNGRRLGRGLVPRLCEIPPDLRKTLTLDNGSEMAGFRELERAGLTHLLLQATFALAARQQRE